MSDWDHESAQMWRDIVDRYANTSQRVMWLDQSAIVRLLDDIGRSSKNQANHTFLPSGGGFDLDEASASVEEGCVELGLNGGGHVVKIKAVTLDTFPEDLDRSWAYFRLELDTLEPVYAEDDSLGQERIFEPWPGQYLPPEQADLEFFQASEGSPQEAFPESARTITRWLGGAIVIFGKCSIYNKIPDTYDGRHGQMGSAAFRAYITELIATVEELRRP